MSSLSIQLTDIKVEQNRLEARVQTGATREPSFQINIYQGVSILWRHLIVLLALNMQTTQCDLAFAKLFTLPVTENTLPFPKDIYYPLPPSFNSASFA